MVCVAFDGQHVICCNEARQGLRILIRRLETTSLTVTPPFGAHGVVREHGFFLPVHSSREGSSGKSDKPAATHYPPTLLQRLRVQDALSVRTPSIGPCLKARPGDGSRPQKNPRLMNVVEQRCFLKYASGATRRDSEGTGRMAP